MRSKCTRRFWQLHNKLPARIQVLAAKAYALWRDDPRHPSLEFKKLKSGGDRFSIRIGAHHRAIAHTINDTVEWVWIGSHEDYNHLV